MQYTIKRSSRKSIAIKISKDGKVKVLTPNKCSLKFIDDFVNSKKDWILTNLQNIADTNASHMQYFNLNKFVVFGEHYDVLEFDNHYRIGEYYIKHTKASNKKMVLKQFAEKLANEYIMQRLENISNILKIDYATAKIISARTKWGSCNNKKELRFNFRLIMLPKYLIDYVICHELCHIKELNHSKDFWALLSNIGFKKHDVKERFKPYSFVLQML